MYCHNCGSHTIPGQNFCRACGANLRAFPESSPGPLTGSAPQRRWQIIVDAVTDALRTGTQILSQQPTAGLAEQGPASRYKRLGLIAFWAGLAALLGNHIAVILILVGIGLMAYARGFFGPLRQGPPARTTEFQGPPSRETSYSGASPRPSAVGEQIENGGWGVEDHS
jgi:hypothetical protein